MANVSFSLTQKFVTDPALHYRVPVLRTGQEGLIKGGFQNAAHFVESALIARIIAVSTSYFAFCDAGIHLCSGNLSRSIFFMRISLFGSVKGTINPDWLRDYSFTPDATPITHEKRTSILNWTLDSSNKLSTPQMNEYLPNASLLQKRVFVDTFSQDQEGYQPIRNLTADNVFRLIDKPSVAPTFLGKLTNPVVKTTLITLIAYGHLAAIALFFDARKTAIAISLIGLASLKANFVSTHSLDCVEDGAAATAKVEWLTQNEINLKGFGISNPSNTKTQGYYYHPTTKAGLEKILNTGVVEVQYEKDSRAAWVLTQPDVNLGKYFLVFRRNIERLSPLEIGYQTEPNAYSAGFSQNIPVTNHTLAYILTNNGDQAELAGQCKTWFGKAIHVIGLDNASTDIQKLRGLNMGIPKEWGNAPEKVSEHVNPTLFIRAKMEMQAEEEQQEALKQQVKAKPKHVAEEIV
jgi:hypothetical protein